MRRDPSDDPSERRRLAGAPLTLRTKLLTTGIVLSATAAAAGYATFGTFDSTTTAAQPFTDATITLALGSTSTLTTAVTGLVPGDTVSRAFTLDSTGTTSSALGTVTLAVTGSGGNALVTDATNGLKVGLQECGTAWTAGTVPTCAGGATSILSSTAVSALGSPQTLSSLASIGVHYLMSTVSFPVAAGNTFQGLSTTLTYSFVATQRAGGAQ
jgi:hypothetical protein